MSETEDIVHLRELYLMLAGADKGSTWRPYTSHASRSSTFAKANRRVHAGNCQPELRRSPVTRTQNTHANTENFLCCKRCSVFLLCIFLLLVFTAEDKTALERFSRRDIVASIPTTHDARASPERRRLGLRELFSPPLHARLHTDRELMHGLLAC